MVRPNILDAIALWYATFGREVAWPELGLGIRFTSIRSWGMEEYRSTDPDGLFITPHYNSLYRSIQVAHSPIEGGQARFN